jgi:hypothetical protein
MPEKTPNEQLNKKDLDIILEVNKKAVEIQTEVAEQNEEIISLLTSNKDTQVKLNEKVDKIAKISEENSRDIFKVQVLFVTGLLSLVIQIIQIFLKK